MITVNNKTVKQPYVAVDGAWKAVSTEYAMVNGEWKEVFPNKGAYTVNIYRYGTLYQTLRVTEGESVTLPSLGVGYATASGSTTTTYNSGATITPTGNMTLYAVFSYSLKIYRFGSVYQTLTSKSQSNKGSFTLPTYGVGYATTSSSTTVSYNNGATISTASTSLYIVYQYSIKLYKYGSLYDTLTVKSQNSTGSFTLPTCTVNADDDAFYGWTKTSGSTTKDYDANQTITSSGMSLYAIFSYKNLEMVTVGVAGTMAGPKEATVTAEYDGTLSFKGYVETKKALASNVTTTNDDITLSSSSVVRISINSTYLTGTIGESKTISKAVSKGDTIYIYAAKGNVTGSSSSAGTTTITTTHYGTLTYPGSSGTEYRSAK